MLLVRKAPLASLVPEDLQAHRVRKVNEVPPARKVPLANSVPRAQKAILDRKALQVRRVLTTLLTSYWSTKITTSQRRSFGKRLARGSKSSVQASSPAKRYRSS